jgi:hypothetical protein
MTRQYNFFISAIFRQLTNLPSWIKSIAIATARSSCRKLPQKISRQAEITWSVHELFIRNACGN